VESKWSKFRKPSWLNNNSKSTILIYQNSVVAQLRPLTQLNTTNKDNAAKLAIDPYAGEFEGRRIRPSILGGLGGQPPDPGSPHTINPKSLPITGE
jgi:hypothetical protein